MVTPPKFWILDVSNRLCILSDAFLIKVFPLCGMVFARPSCCGWPLLGVVLTVARDCVPPSFNVRLPCDACISGGSSGCFSEFFLLDWSFGLGAASAPDFSDRELIINHLYYKMG